jgi:hypothetical protein
MPPSLEKPKRKKKDQKQKQKQKQEQTVIVNIHKGKKSSAPRNNGIEKPKEPKEQPKTYNSFSFSSPQAQNPIGEYLKMYSKDLYSKIEQSIKSRDAVINSADEATKPIITVKSAERTSTPLITPRKSPENTLQENYLRNQEQIPLTIGDSTVLDIVTTLDTPVELSSPLPEPSPEEITKDTVEAIKKVEEPPDLFTVLASPISVPTGQVQRQLKGARQLGRPPGTTKEVMAERALMGQEDTRTLESQKIARPVGRPPGTARNLQAMYEDPENQPRIIPVKPLPPPRSRILSAPNISGRLASFNSPLRQDSSDLSIPARFYRRKSEDSPFTEFEQPPKSTPIRRSSLNIGSRLGSPV